MSKVENAAVQGLIANRATIAPAATGQPGAFEAVLADRLKVSGHAKTRLESRNINLDDSDWLKVLGAVDMAASKGAKESLVLLDKAALVVSVRNRTVITAMDRESLQNNVFTNIDSAVVV